MDIENQKKPLAFDEDIVRAFVGANADYYLTKWKAAKDPEIKSGWSWAAFLAGMFWLIYRKMYLMAFIIYGIFVVVDIAEIFLDLGDHLSKGASLSMTAALGVLGNSFYYRHMKKKITSIQKKYKDDIERQNREIEKAGGTSWLSVGIVVLAIILEVILISFFEGE